MFLQALSMDLPFNGVRSRSALEGQRTVGRVWTLRQNWTVPEQSINPFSGANPHCLFLCSSMDSLLSAGVETYFQVETLLILWEIGAILLT